MTIEIRRELQNRDVKDIIEVYALNADSCQDVVNRIISDLEADERGETISYTLVHAVHRLRRIGYGIDEITGAFHGTKWEQQVAHSLKNTEVN